MKFLIELTWSKFMALVLLGCAVYLDKVNGLPGTVTMFSTPFVVFLITGKQFFDHRKAIKTNEES